MIERNKLNRSTISRRSFLNSLGTGGAALSFMALTHAISPSKIISSMFTGKDPDLELLIRAKPDTVAILKGPETKVWRYEGEIIRGQKDALQIIPGSFLGPIIHARRGQAVRIHFINELPESSIIHWHGLHVPEMADGHPRLAIKTSETYTYDFTVLDRAGMYWYHPHPHGRTGPQVYFGLAGLFIVTDNEEDELNLPSQEYDVPIVLQDRVFDENNQFVYDLEEVQGFGAIGDRYLVNGLPDYELPVATRPYRLRVLNGSNARIYTLAWSDSSPFTVIGTDGGLLEVPAKRDYLVLSPAERVDLWVDFSKYKIGRQLQLLDIDPYNLNFAEGKQILSIKINKKENVDSSVPLNLSALHLNEELEAVNQNNPKIFGLSMGTGMMGLINGKSFDMTGVDLDEQVKLGDLEVWQFDNLIKKGETSMPHPMHIHGLQFQILQRQSDPKFKEINALFNKGQVDEGWHDTVLVMPGEKVKILLKFEDYEGLYLYHCHNLEHEDMGMMRNCLIVK